MQDRDSSQLSSGDVLQDATTNTARCMQGRKTVLKQKQILLIFKGYTVCFL